MAPLTRSMSVRLAGIMLAGLVLFNICMALALYAPIGRQREALYLLPLPRQAAAIVDVIEATPPASRARVLQALNSTSMTVRLLDRIPPAGDAAGARPVARLLSGYDEAFPDHDIRLELQRYRPLRRLLARDRIANWVPMRLYVHLHDGPYVMIEPARAALFDRFLARGLILGGIAGLIVFAGLFFAVRQTAKPIATLADSARRFADNMDVPDLPLEGPREMRELAEAFNEMKARIRHLVAERTRVLAAIAHDLRTYLTRLNLRAEFIADNDQRARARADLEEMSALIDDTLLLARDAAQGTRPASDLDLVTEVESFVAARTELGQPVTLAAPGIASAPVRIDTVALKRMLSNLTDNAIRYGGNARLSISRAGSAWRIAVEDDGPGIPETDLQRVVAPFERLEPSRGRAGGGAGLGLAIVKALADSQGVRFALSNRAGGGLSAELLFAGASPAAAAVEHD